MQLKQDIQLSRPLRLTRFQRVLGFLEQMRASQAAGFVLAAALVQRLLLWLYYGSISYGDTPAYWRMAAAVTGDWSAYDGTRTPGYPLVLALFKSDEAVWLAQMAMGLAVTLLIFYLGWQVSGKAWFAGLAALAHTLNPGQVFFEPNLLSETATTFWLALTAAGIFVWVYRPQQRNILLAVVLSLVSAMVWLTRPLFIFLPFWTLFFLVVPLIWKPGFAEWKNPAKLLRKAFSPLAYLLVSGAVIFGWLSFIHLRFGDWSITTMTGYHMVQHTGGFFEYVPDQYAGLRDTYLRYRAEQIARHGSQTNTIWRAIPEMQEVSGENFYSLSRLLARISTRLILEHPDLYLRNALKGWWYFWRGPVYWSPQAFEPQWIGKTLGPLVLAGRLSTFTVNLVFLASTAGLAWGKIRRAWRISPGLYWIAGTVWASSVVQTLADHGDNPRFLVPLQSFVVLWVFWIAWQSVQQGRTREQ